MVGKRCRRASSAPDSRIDPLIPLPVFDHLAKLGPHGRFYLPSRCPRSQSRSGRDRRRLRSVGSRPTGLLRAEVIQTPINSAPQACFVNAKRTISWRCEASSCSHARIRPCRSMLNDASRCLLRHATCSTFAPRHCWQFSQSHATESDVAKSAQGSIPAAFASN
jgi:hypothetical protein